MSHLVMANKEGAMKTEADLHRMDEEHDMNKHLRERHEDSYPPPNGTCRLCGAELDKNGYCYMCRG